MGLLQHYMQLQACLLYTSFPHVNAICQEIKAKYEYADADYMVVVPDGILAVSYTHLDVYKRQRWRGCPAFIWMTAGAGP